MQRALGRVLQFGGLFVTRYELNAGQGVPMHTHKPDTEHITIVCKGAALVRGEGFHPFTIDAGQVYDYPPTQQTHELVALHDGTVLLNVPKGIAPQ